MPDDFLDDEELEGADEFDDDEEDGEEELADAEGGAEADETEAEPEAAEEEEVDVGPDHPDAVGALKQLGARLETNDKGNVWRIIFYEQHKDNAIAQIHGLPGLKEVWVIGTKVSREMVKEFREQYPKVTVYF